MGSGYFSDDFKRDAVVQIIDKGHSVAEMSRRLGVSRHTLYAWKRQFARPSGVNAERPLPAPRHHKPVRVVPIRWIEDLRDAVHGAGLRATQMSRGPLSGSLASIEDEGFLYSSGHMQGQVALSGHMLPNTVTIGFALRAPPGTRHGQHEISTGNLVLLMPGEEQHAFYMPDSLYLATTIRPERLEMEGAHEDLVFDRHKFAGSGVHRYKAPPGVTAAIGRRLDLLHAAGSPAPVRDLIAALRLMRRVIVTYFGRAAHGRALTAQPGLQSRIFARAQRHIEEHLDGHITIDALAAAAFTSRRTLYRTFLRMVDESPQAYVRRLRLHRLRYDLVSEAEARCTVEMAATRWGMGEFGRIAGRYRELFGELPSQTLKRRRADRGSRRPDR